MLFKGLSQCIQGNLCSKCLWIFLLLFFLVNSAPNTCCFLFYGETSVPNTAYCFFFYIEACVQNTCQGWEIIWKMLGSFFRNRVNLQRKSCEQNGWNFQSDVFLTKICCKENWKYKGRLVSKYRTQLPHRLVNTDFSVGVGLLRPCFGLDASRHEPGMTVTFETQWHCVHLALWHDAQRCVGNRQDQCLDGMLLIADRFRMLLGCVFIACLWWCWHT